MTMLKALDNDSASVPTAEQIEARKRWVAELRSGRYKQLREQLRNRKGDKRCCLGVACLPRVTGIRLRVDESGYSVRTEDGGRYYEDAYLPQPIMDAMGITNSNPRVSFEGEFKRLSQLNDMGQSFEVIAELIEQQYIKPYETKEQD